MPQKLENPVAVYTAETNTQAHLIKGILAEKGIAAFAIDDMSPGGMYSLGTLSELHRPQVFVDKQDVDAAAQFLKEYDGRDKKLASDHYCFYCGAVCDTNATVCRECGAALMGTVEQNPQEQAEMQSPGPLAILKKLHKPFAWLVILFMLSTLIAKLLGF